MTSKVSVPKICSYQRKNRWLNRRNYHAAQGLSTILLWFSLLLELL